MFVPKFETVVSKQTLEFVHGEPKRIYIDGRWVESKSGKSRTCVDPASGRTICEVQAGDATDVDLAVKAARRAFVDSEWSRLLPADRQSLLLKLADAIEKHGDTIAEIETLNQGQLIEVAKAVEVNMAVDFVRYMAGWATKLEGSTLDLSLREPVGMKFHAYTRREPVGVVAAIVPWNFPHLMALWKIVPALACGCTVVLKPAEDTPLTALYLATLIEEVGFPAGAVNVVTGTGFDVGSPLVSHPLINKVAFTGSTKVGQTIGHAAIENMTRFSVETGGKSPVLVLDDIDPDFLGPNAAMATFFNHGQQCVAGSRIYLPRKRFNDYLDRIIDLADYLKVGSGFDPKVHVGPMVSKVHHDRVRGFIERGKAAGATVAAGADPIADNGGFFIRPTVLTGVDHSFECVSEEIFGPVICVMQYDSIDELVGLANNTEYGLAASIWSETLSLALDIAPKLKCGVVWVNGTNMFDAGVGFGGYKESGYGREGGREGLAAYCKPKWLAKAKPIAALPTVEANGDVVSTGFVDRTAKLYVGGKQARPDGGYSRPVVSPSGALVGEVGDGNRKDIRNAVEAARKATGWATTAEHSRAQILYYIAENLDARSGEFADRLAAMTGRRKQDTAREVAASVSRLFAYGAWADKFEGAVHKPPLRGVALAMNEPLGIIGIACPEEHGLLGFVSTFAPAIAMGNRVVVVPSSRQALAATDFYQVLETSDVPDGVVNIVTGDRDALALELAKHEEVDGIWYFGGREAAARIEKASTGNLKQVWAETVQRDWYDARQGEGREILSRAVQVKNIWVPYGE